jgi:hypothetical protein
MTLNAPWCYAVSKGRLYPETFYTRNEFHSEVS